MSLFVASLKGFAWGEMEKTLILETERQTPKTYIKTAASISLSYKTVMNLDA